MKSVRYLLIGGGLACSQAAKQLRQQEPDATIMLVGDEPYVPYDRPPLSKEYLRGEKTGPQLFFDPEGFYRETNIDLLLCTAVHRVDIARKTASLADGGTVTFEKALIATGGRPIQLHIPGSHLPGVQYLRTLDDSSSISARAVPGVHAVIIGAGFIGTEAAASLTQRGVRVTVVESQRHIWPRFADKTLATFIQDYCTLKGITFRTNDQVTTIGDTDHVAFIRLKSGEELPCDFVCIGIGIIPNVELAQQAGLEIDNGIVVNEYLQSSHPDIYAAGDVANYLDPLFDKRRRVEHWGHAEYCGQLAGQNMGGGRNPYDLLTYIWSDIFDLHLEFAGDESEHDQVIIRGQLASQSFVMLYLKQHVLKAYCAINANSKDFPPLQRLIRRKKDLAGKEGQLQDPTVPLKSLI